MKFGNLNLNLTRSIIILPSGPSAPIVTVNGDGTMTVACVGQADAPIVTVNGDGTMTAACAI